MGDLSTIAQQSLTTLFWFADALKSTPIAAVSQQAAEKAQAVQGLITGQTKVPEFYSSARILGMSFLHRNLRLCQSMWKRPWQCHTRIGEAYLVPVLSKLVTSLATVSSDLVFALLREYFSQSFQRWCCPSSSSNHTNLRLHTRSEISWWWQGALFKVWQCPQEVYWPIHYFNSTVFLVGPKRQCENMFTGHRAMASSAYFGSMIGTIYAAMGLRIYLLVIVLIGNLILHCGGACGRLLRCCVGQVYSSSRWFGMH